MTDTTREASLLAAQHHDEHVASLAPHEIASRDGIIQVSGGQTIEAAKDIVFGSAAGMAGKVIEYPFDTVKVRLQSSSRYAGPLDCLVQSFRSEGITGLYRGISAPLVGAAMETSSLFFSYRLAQEAFRKTLYRDTKADEPLTMPALLACGAISGAATSLILTPIELVKCQLQVPLDAHGAGMEAGAGKTVVQRNLVTTIATIYRHNGLVGFWHGQLGTLIRETGGGAAWFGVYEGATRFFRKRRDQMNDGDFAKTGKPGSKTPLPIWQQMTAGACAGVSYNFLFYPADTIKSRMQTADPGDAAMNHGKRPTFLGVGRLLWQEQGLRGMYRGCGITLARAAPASAFIFTVNETLRSWFA